MTGFGATARPPRAAMRSLLRSPVVVFRLRCDGIFRGRLLLLRHRGRCSGRIHETVLEVVVEREFEVIVISAWGRRSGWYRNLEVAGASEITLRGRRHPHPRHRLLDEDETMQALRAYGCEHGVTARIAETLFGWPLSGPDEALRELARATGGVAFALGAKS